MSLAFILLIAIAVITFIIRVPIGYGLLSAGIVYLLVSHSDLGLASTTITTQLNAQFVLIAVPLFIFAAEIMNESTITDRLFDFANTVVGRFYGAMAQVNVLAAVVFSGMSGSAIADVSGIGVMGVKAMERQGYPKPYACATVSAAATIGPIIPPSIPMVIYAAIAGTSVGALFAGGILPGVIIAIALMILIRFTAKRRGYPRGGVLSLRAVLVGFVAAFPALLTPVVLLFGIYSGLFTPTEAAAVAALYALVVAAFIYRALPWSVFKKVINGTVLRTGQTAMMIASAFLVNYAVVSEGVAANLADLGQGLTSHPLLLFLLLNLIFLIAGMFLETVILQLIMVPLVLPLVREAGIDLVAFGVIITLNQMIGLVTPPLGVSLFISGGLTKTPMGPIFKEILPYLAVLITVVVLLTVFPQIVLVVPHALGY
jgi:tripartite ATP-independent transporter DctM subunit